MDIHGWINVKKKKQKKNPYFASMVPHESLKGFRA